MKAAKASLPVARGNRRPMKATWTRGCSRMSSRPEWLTGLAHRAAPPRPQPCNSSPALTRGGKRESSVSPRAVTQLPVAKTRRPRHSKAVSRHNRDDGIKSDRTDSDSCSYTDPSGLEEDEEGFCDDERRALDRAAVHEDSGLGSSVTDDGTVSREAGGEGLDAPGSSVRSCPGSDASVAAWSRTSVDLDDSPFLPAVTSSWKRDEDSADLAKSGRHNFAAGERNTLDELLGKKAEAVESGVGMGTECGGAVGTRRPDVSGHVALPDASLFSPTTEKRDSGIRLTPNSSILDYGDDGDTSGRDSLDGARASTSLSPPFLKTPQPNRRGRERGASSVFRTPVTALARTFNLDPSSPGGLRCSPSLGGRDAVPGSPAVDDDGSFRCVFSERGRVVTEGGNDADERSLDGSGDDLTPDLWPRSRRLGRLQSPSTIREGGSRSDVDDGRANVQVARHAEEAAAASGSPSCRRVVNTRSQRRMVTARDGVASAALRNAAVHTAPPCVSRHATPPTRAGVVSADAVLTPALRLQQEVAWRFCQGLQEATPVGASGRASTSAWRHSPAQLNDAMKQALASVPVALRESPSLKQLIGREMGCKFLDIIAALEEKGLRRVVCQLLGYLSAADHDRLCQVSAVWRAAVDWGRALGLLTPKPVPVIWHKVRVGPVSVNDSSRLVCGHAEVTSFTRTYQTRGQATTWLTHVGTSRCPGAVPWYRPAKASRRRRPRMGRRRAAERAASTSASWRWAARSTATSRCASARAASLRRACAARRSGRCARGSRARTTSARPAGARGTGHARAVPRGRRAGGRRRRCPAPSGASAT
ncbi:uncharacterized protein LOC133362136 isoform X1 [Lethenteron reissneri]|uniref:uncharacterized protein LOC133362136 isoform X1 n=1 Tax=Lethenteron reissneri TaxID=7753 RepID=UPI002AB614C1|nr:uncharacterized protein LOC133362136 isoform X1 [Lethenteron reissneri]